MKKLLLIGLLSLLFVFSSLPLVFILIKLFIIILMILVLISTIKFKKENFLVKYEFCLPIKKVYVPDEHKLKKEVEDFFANNEILIAPSELPVSLVMVELDGNDLTIQVSSDDPIPLAFRILSNYQPVNTDDVLNYMTFITSLKNKYKLSSVTTTR